MFVCVFFSTCVYIVPAVNRRIGMLKAIDFRTCQTTPKETNIMASSAAVGSEQHQAS